MGYQKLALKLADEVEFFLVEDIDNECARLSKQWEEEYYRCHAGGNEQVRANAAISISTTCNLLTAALHKHIRPALMLVGKEQETQDTVFLEEPVPQLWVA